MRLRWPGILLALAANACGSSALPSRADPSQQADGGASADGSVSEDADFGNDAPVNDPACPATWSSSCQTPCSPVGLRCQYPGPAGGDALLCTSPDAGLGEALDSGPLPAGAGVWVCEI